MNNLFQSGENNLLLSSLFGFARGISVCTLVHPLTVVRNIRQSREKPETSCQVAKRIFMTEGAKGFFKGLSPHLINTSIKQTYCWPMITGIPPFLEKYQFSTYSQQIVAGATIAITDALVTSPLERVRLLRICTNKETRITSQLLRDGWYGSGMNWMRLSVIWISFLTSQKYFRNRFYESHPDQEMSLKDKVKIGAQVGGVVSILSSPFEAGNTIRQIQKKNLFKDLTMSNFRIMFRGLPLHMVTIGIHNIASIFLSRDDRKKPKTPIAGRTFGASMVN